MSSPTPPGRTPPGPGDAARLATLADIHLILAEAQEELKRFVRAELASQTQVLEGKATCARVLRAASHGTDCSSQSWPCLPGTESDGHGCGHQEAPRSPGGGSGEAAHADHGAHTAGTSRDGIATKVAVESCARGHPGSCDGAPAPRRVDAASVASAAMASVPPLRLERLMDKPAQADSSCSAAAAAAGEGRGGWGPRHGDEKPHGQAARQGVASDGSRPHHAAQPRAPGTLERCGWFGCLVGSHHLDYLCGAVIICNSLCIGLQANQRAIHPTEPCAGPWGQINLAFNAFFFAELVVRLTASRLQFFVGRDFRWNLFDLILVIAALCEEVIQRALLPGGCGGASAEIGKGVTALRIIRILRLIRVVRAVRVLHLFRELRVMVQSILRCLVPLCWACLLLFVIQWCFGIYFVHVATDYIEDRLRHNEHALLEDESVSRLREYYGSLWQALYTMFLSVTGGLDWGGAADSLAVTGYHAMLLYVFFVALTVFAVLNVVTGVFVQNATNMAWHDRDSVIREQYIKDALSVFREWDSAGTGQINLETFEKLLEDKRMQAFISYLELSGVEARHFFNLLDCDSNGEVDAEEFVTGCLCLRGGAKTIDVAVLVLEQRRFLDNLHEQFQYILSMRSCDQVLWSPREGLPGEEGAAPE